MHCPRAPRSWFFLDQVQPTPPRAVGLFLYAPHSSCSNCWHYLSGPIAFALWPSFWLCHCWQSHRVTYFWVSVFPSVRWVFTDSGVLRETWLTMSCTWPQHALPWGPQATGQRQHNWEPERELTTPNTVRVDTCPHTKGGRHNRCPQNFMLWVLFHRLVSKRALTSKELKNGMKNMRKE